jgi:hypothetical protein
MPEIMLLVLFLLGSGVYLVRMIRIGVFITSDSVMQAFGWSLVGVAGILSLTIVATILTVVRRDRIRREL